jgi:2-polyprenyl-6-methoxyphenol hydroxylase-like FAD-dependent oxidoreductase
VTGAIKSAARELPIIIGGGGPGGMTAAIGLQRAGELVHVFEARGPEATRARNIFLRPEAREILADIGVGDPGRDSTIMSIENRLRGIAADESVPVDYHQRILDVIPRKDYVSVKVKADGQRARTVRASVFVDASGGRIEATNSGMLKRLENGPHHVYVTAQYDTPAPFNKVYGAYDWHTDEGMFFFPIPNKGGFVAYYDRPPGQGIQNEQALLARFDTLAGRLQLGTPVSPPQAFDAQQHLSRSAASGRILKIGDSAGNADPYIGAGMAAALVDARAATRALTAPGSPEALVRNAAARVLDGHRQLGREAGLMVRTRGIGMRLLPPAHFDERLKPDDMGSSFGLDLVQRFLTRRSVS